MYETPFIIITPLTSYQFITGLLHIAAKNFEKLVMTKSPTQNLLVLMQVITNLLASYFDFSVYNPSQVSGTLLSACQQVLLALKPAVDGYPLPNHELPVPGSNTLCVSVQSIALQIKSLLMAHEQRLGSLSNFAPLAQLCEDCSIPSSLPHIESPLLFPPLLVKDLHEHFEWLMQQVRATSLAGKQHKQQHEHEYDPDRDSSTIPPDPDPDPDPHEDEDEELAFELDRLRRG